MKTISKIYQAFDDALMKGANISVQGWNWLTGDTKAGLANTFLTLGTISAASLPLVDEKEFLGLNIFITALTGAGSYLKARNNRELEKADEDANTQGLKSYEALEARAEGMVYGPSLLGLAVIPLLLPMKLLELFAASSLYVMRADSPTPRKDCISRGIDKIKDAVQNYRAKETLVPALARNRSYLDRLLEE